MDVPFSNKFLMPCCVGRQKTATNEFDRGHLSQTLLAVSAPVVAFKLEFPGRPSKLLNAVRVQLQGGTIIRIQAELQLELNSSLEF